MRKVNLQKLMEASEWLLNEWLEDNEGLVLSKKLIDKATERAILIWNGGKNAHLPWYEVDKCMGIFNRVEK